MDADQYRAAINALGLNLTGAARFLGISLSTSQRHAEGNAAVPQRIAILLSLMLHLQISPVTARETAGLLVEDYKDGRINNGKPRPSRK
jgi:hypothetical protein